MYRQWVKLDIESPSYCFKNRYQLFIWKSLTFHKNGKMLSLKLILRRSGFDIFIIQKIKVLLDDL